jgi:hypothetical protein
MGNIRRARLEKPPAISVGTPKSPRLVNWATGVFFDDPERGRIYAAVHRYEAPVEWSIISAVPDAWDH